MPKRINRPAPPKKKKKRTPAKRKPGSTARRHKYWEEDFFKAFLELGTQARACAAAGVHRKTVYDRRHSDSVFAARYDACVTATLAKFESIAHKVAEGYRDEDGKLQQPSVSMLGTVLRALDPATYGGKAHVEITGKGGGPVVAIAQADIGDRLAELAKDPEAMSAMRLLAKLETKRLTAEATPEDDE
jgi:hypothetical protein